MTTNFDNLTDSELRSALKEIGYDVPVSVNREFLVKKLKSYHEDGNKNGGPAKRRSTGRASLGRVEGGFRVPESNGPTPTRNKSPSRAKPSSRMSYQPPAASDSAKKTNDLGLRRSIQVSSGNGGVSVNPNYRSTISSRGRSNASAASTLADESDSDFDMTAPSPSANLSPLSDGDASWSSRPNPANWSRFSSLFPTPLNGTPPSTFATPGERSSRLHAASTPIPANGNWRNTITTQATPTTSRIGSTPYPRRGTSAVLATPSKSIWRKFKDCFGGSGSDGGGLVSSILVGVAVLFFALIAVVYMNLPSGNVPAALDGKSSVKPTWNINIDTDQVLLNLKNFFGYGPKPLPTTLSNNYPICGQPDVDPKACIRAEHLKGARGLFTVLKEELVQRAKWGRCWFSDNVDLHLNEAKSKLLRLSTLKKQDVEDCFQEMLVLCVENPNWGLKVTSEDGKKEIINAKDLFAIDYAKAKVAAVNVQSSTLCNLIGYGQAGFKYFLTTAGVLFLGFICYKTWQMYLRKKREGEQELFDYIESALEMIQSHHEAAKEKGDDNYVAVNHVRDTLIPAKDRLAKSALWNKVVYFISNHETRVREEIQHISGEEFRVWRWLPSAATPMSTPRSRLSNVSLPNNSGTPPTPTTPETDYTANDARPPVGTPLPGASQWQGQAFEMANGSPNALPQNLPANCLKIRHMYAPKVAEAEREAHIQTSILRKCPNAVIFHIGMDQNSADGCVYVRCATNADAGKAFQSLHGWWFEGNLLSVKFLREERYFVRFPETKGKNSRLKL